MRPARKGDGTGLSFPGYSEVRKGDGDVVWSAGADIPDSGVARYEFEQDVTDSWGDNDGSITGDPQFVTDAVEGSYAIEFDGEDDLVSVDSVASSISPPVSVATWVKPASVSSSNVIFATQYNRFSLNISNDVSDAVALRIADSNGNSSTASYSSISAGTWIHVVGTFDTDDSGELYVDGNPQGTLSNVLDERTEATIGNQPNGNDPLDGIVDEMRVYSKVLSDSEVLDLYNTGRI